MLSGIDICTRALRRVGAKAIASFDDGSAGAEACGAEYDPTVRACLTMPGGKPFRWGWATAQSALSRLTDTPVGRYAYAWQMPPDALAIHGVFVNGVPIEFGRYDDMLYCDADDGAVADYTFRAEEGTFPPYFVEALTTEMAAKLALGLNRDEKLAETLTGQAAAMWAGARSAEAQGRSSRRIRANRLTAARFGRGGWG